MFPPGNRLSTGESGAPRNFAGFVDFEVLVAEDQSALLSSPLLQMKKSLVVALSCLSLAGCVSINKQAMAPGAGKDLKDHSIAQTQRPLPDFSAMTPTRAALGMIGGVMMISEGNALIAGNKVVDPAGAIASSLAKELESAYGAKATEQRVAVTASEVERISEAGRASARFIVDVQTINWSFTYFPTDWTRYRVIYSAKARLNDTTNKTTLAEGFCSRIPDSNANAPSYDELTANEAAMLKRELVVAAEHCAKTLKQEMLAL